MNRLKLNADKTQIMWSGKRQRLSKVSMAAVFIKGHAIIPACSVTCCLGKVGITVDTELTFALAFRCEMFLPSSTAVDSALSVDSVKKLVRVLLSSHAD